jgi:hypothetical protein
MSHIGPPSNDVPSNLTKLGALPPTIHTCVSGDCFPSALCLSAPYVDMNDVVDSFASPAISPELAFTFGVNLEFYNLWFVTRAHL